MDILSLLRTLGALGLVLGLLASALWVVRRYDLRLPGRTGGGSGRRLELVERLGIDQRRSAVLLRRDGREHLILLTPEGATMVESIDAPAAAPLMAEALPRPPAAPPPDFTAFVEQVLERSRVRVPRPLRRWFAKGA